MQSVTCCGHAPSFPTLEGLSFQLKHRIIHAFLSLVLILSALFETESFYGMPALKCYQNECNKNGLPSRKHLMEAHFYGNFLLALTAKTTEAAVT